MSIDIPTYYISLPKSLHLHYYRHWLISSVTKSTKALMSDSQYLELKIIVHMSLEKALLLSMVLGGTTGYDNFNSPKNSK
jgi:hypothetical protein